MSLNLSLCVSNMGSKSVSTSLTNYRQRINRVEMPNAYKKDKDGNVTNKHITTEEIKCRNCNKSYWYSFVRCDECGETR